MAGHKDIIRLIESMHEETVFAALGIRVESYDPAGVIVAIDVDRRHLQHSGIVHGGVYVVLAESAASIAAALKVGIERYHIAGMEINANHLGAVASGVVRAKATLAHHGRTLMVYTIELTDDKSRLVCISRCTIAIRDKKQDGQ